VAEFIEHDTAQFKASMRERIETGRSSWTLEEVDERALEIAEELRADLQTCALFELEVQHNDRRFHASDFSNSATGLCGWEPAFLSPDGESIITEGSWVPPELESFRVAFYVHEWSESGRLVGPTGELELPTSTPVPARLWNLAPYACLD
jgi:GAF domain-containing protein